jgi:hypothetical protein
MNKKPRATSGKGKGKGKGNQVDRGLSWLDNARHAMVSGNYIPVAQHQLHENELVKEITKRID